MARLLTSVKGVVNPLIAMVLISIILVLGWGLLSITIDYLSIVRSEQQLYTFISRVSSDTYFYIEALFSNESTYTVYVGLLRASNTPTTYYLCVIDQLSGKPIENVDVETLDDNGGYQDADSVDVESNNIYVLSEIAKYLPLSAKIGVYKVVSLYTIKYIGLKPISVKVSVEAEDSDSKPRLLLVLLVAYEQKYYEVKRLYVEWERT